jgi:deoxyribonuclease-4
MDMHNSMTFAGADAAQIFVKPPKQHTSLPVIDVNEFVSTMQRWTVIAHGGFICNPASNEKRIQSLSEKSIQDDLSKCRSLNIPYLVVHPGSGKGQQVSEAIKNAATFLKKAAEFSSHTMILIETMAGMGTQIGRTFEEIRQIMDLAGPDNFGVCLDTCHIFSAGYDLSSFDAVCSTFAMFDDIVGLSSLKVVHVSESKNELGSYKERHAPLGSGHIGLQGFHTLLRVVPEYIPFILETPPGTVEGFKVDIAILKYLQSRDAIPPSLTREEVLEEIGLL